MTDLVDAYQRRDVHSAEKILRGTFVILIHQCRTPEPLNPAENKSTFRDDLFIKSYIGELLRSLRTQYLIDLIKPYTRLELSFLAKVRMSFIDPLLRLKDVILQQLNVEIDEVEELLIGLILEGKIEGHIDQVAMRLELDRKLVPLR